MPYQLEKTNRTGSGGVEGFSFSGHGTGDTMACRVFHVLRQPGAFVADQENGGAAQVHLEQRFCTFCLRHQCQHHFAAMMTTRAREITLALLAARSEGATVCPSEIARAIASARSTIFS